MGHAHFGLRNGRGTKTFTKRTLQIDMALYLKTKIPF
jgi:hypothetical protein